MYSVIGADGQLYGPVPMDTLQQWCREGRVLPTTNLLAAGSSQMLRASDISELHPFFVQPGPIGQTYQGQPHSQQTHTPIQQGHPIQQDPSQPNLGGIRHDPYVPGGIQNPSHPHQQGPTPFGQGPTPFQKPNYYGQPGAVGVPSKRSKTVAVIIILICGPLGIHDFYLGYGRDGAIMLGLTVLGLLTCGLGIGILILLGTTIWSIIDLFKILAGTMPDADGNPLQ